MDKIIPDLAEKTTIENDDMVPVDSGTETFFAKQSTLKSFYNPLPSQTSNAGKFLQTDGTDTSWQAVDALPSQSGNAGKFLKTDGTDTSWADISQPVALQVGKTTTQSISGIYVLNTITNWDTPSLDTHSAFNKTTGIFTVPSPGIYIFGSGLLFQPTTNEVYTQITSTKASSVSMVAGSSAGVYKGAQAHCVANLSLGDKIFVQAQSSSSATIHTSQNWFYVLKMN